MLYLYISGGCNLRCRHCWITPGYDPDASSGAFRGDLLAAVERVPSGSWLTHPDLRRRVEKIQAARLRAAFGD